MHINIALPVWVGLLIAQAFSQLKTMQLTYVERLDVQGFRAAIQARKPNKIDPDLKRDLEHGWLIPSLMIADDATWGRWDYWYRTMLAGKTLDEPIPQIIFDSGAVRSAEGEGSLVRKHIEKCLGLIPRCGGWQGISFQGYLNYFLDWLLFGLGDSDHKELPKEANGCEGASMRLYQIFNLNLLIAYPYDYWGGLLAEFSVGKGHGFFPTSHILCEMMVEMIMGGKDCKTASVYEPCAGTGRMLLYASNRSLDLYGQEINHTVYKCCKVNGYLYAPWLMRGFSWLKEEQKAKQRDAEAKGESSDSLTLPPLPTFGSWFDDETEDSEEDEEFEIDDSETEDSEEEAIEDESSSVLPLPTFGDWFNDDDETEASEEEVEIDDPEEESETEESLGLPAAISWFDEEE